MIGRPLLSEVFVELEERRVKGSRRGGGGGEVAQGENKTGIGEREGFVAPLRLLVFSLLTCQTAAEVNLSDEKKGSLIRDFCDGFFFISQRGSGCRKLYK